MRTTIGTLVGLLMLTTSTTWARTPQPGKQIACTLKVQGKTDAKPTTIRYWLFVPSNYESQQKWPLMLFLHGAGERGTDLELVKKWGPPRIAEQQKDFPFVLVSPQCPKGVWWDIDPLIQLVDHVANTCKVDKRRMYVTGLSMGGFATWSILAKYPQVFAAAVPICGGGDPADAPKMIGVPIWAFHGEADHTVPVQRSKEMVEAIKKAGGDVRLTTYPGVGHNSWSATYANEKLYQWLLSHQRRQ